MLNYKVCIFSIFFFACLATAQQQQQPPQPQQQQNGATSIPGPKAAAALLAAPTCNFTSVKPAPQTKSYNLNFCIVAKFAAYLSIGEGKYIELDDGVVANSSHCQNQTDPKVDPMLVVTFPCGEVEFEITRNDSKVLIKSINGYYYRADNSIVSFTNSTPMFETSADNHYYKCNAEQSILVKPVPVTNVTHHLVISNFAYEAYRTASGTDFYQIPEECALDIGQVSDLVRIGVGICLVALVVIVLIAYFVGRRRWAERSSYESV